MQPKLSKAERKALRFAYDLLRGRFDGWFIPYVHGLVLREHEGKPLLIAGQWIEPDRAPDRPYLNEETLAALTTREYLECQAFMADHVWLYRLTRQGCEALGLNWPGGALRKYLVKTYSNGNGHPHNGVDWTYPSRLPRRDYLYRTSRTRPPYRR